MSHSIIYNVHLYAPLLKPKQYKQMIPLYGVDEGWEGGSGDEQKGKEGELGLVCKMKCTFFD